MKLLKNIFSLSTEWNHDPRNSLAFKLHRKVATSMAKLRGADVKMYGLSHMVLRNKYGDVIHETWQTNLITNAGFEGVADAVANTANTDKFTYIYIGSGTTAPAVGDTAPETQLARQDASGSYAYTSGTKSWKISTTFAAGTGTGAVTESGVLDAATSGTLLNRQTFSVINKGASDSLTVEWEFTLS